MLQMGDFEGGVSAGVAETAHPSRTQGHPQRGRHPKPTATDRGGSKSGCATHTGGLGWAPSSRPQGASREGAALSQAGPKGEGRASNPSGDTLALAETPQLEPQLQEAMGLEDGWRPSPRGARGSAQTHSPRSASGRTPRPPWGLRLWDPGLPGTRGAHRNTQCWAQQVAGDGLGTGWGECRVGLQRVPLRRPATGGPALILCVACFLQSYYHAPSR